MQDVFQLKIISLDSIEDLEQEKIHQHSLEMYFVLADLLEKFKKIKEDLERVDRSYLEIKTYVDKVTAISFQEEDDA